MPLAGFYLLNKTRQKPAPCSCWKQYCKNPNNMLVNKYSLYNCFELPKNRHCMMYHGIWIVKVI